MRFGSCYGDEGEGLYGTLLIFPERNSIFDCFFLIHLIIIIIIISFDLKEK